MAFIKINKQNFFHNLNQFSLKTGSKESVSIVLKDNAYGHGLELMAELAKEFGLSQAVVRTHAEAQQIKQYFDRILILGDRAMVDEQSVFVLNDLRDIEQAQSGSMVELKVDTGMHRNGVLMDDLDQALRQIEQKELKLLGVMSHNRSADELSSELFWQQKNFEQVKRRVGELWVDEVYFHSFNSASALRLPCGDQDLIRLGIGAYGYSELPEIYGVLDLKPVMSLWAKRVSTRLVKKGQRIGYGGAFEAPNDMLVSTYDLGYGDGWMRSNGFDSFVTAEGLEILGRVSMDYIVIESTKDEICIFDNALEAGRQVGTISYEVMTQLSCALERITV